MAICTHHPKRVKNCVFCENWFGDANIEPVNSIVGYKYDGNARGKCIKKNTITAAVYSCRSDDYEPSLKAKRLL